MSKYYRVRIDNLNLHFQEEEDNGFYSQLNKFFQRLQSMYGEDISILDVKEIKEDEH